MASETIFASSSSEQRWDNLISKTLDGEHIISIDMPVCVFHVPETIRAAKPEAYAPKKIGMGPYHHLQPQLYHMEKRKLAAVRRFMEPEKIKDFPWLVRKKVEELEPTMVACYDKYLDLDARTLAWILTIDGLFLLDLLLDYPKQGHVVDPVGRELAQDILMAENQIPIVLLKEIRKVISSSLRRGSMNVPANDDKLIAIGEPEDFVMQPGDMKSLLSINARDAFLANPGDDNREVDAFENPLSGRNERDDSMHPWPSDDGGMSYISSANPYSDMRLWSDVGDFILLDKYYQFCTAHSPLQLTEEIHVKCDQSRMHLLDYMYYWIVNNRGIQDIPMFLKASVADIVEEIELKLAENAPLLDDARKLAGECNCGALNFLLDLPLDECLDSLRMCFECLQKERSAVKITIPSATELSNVPEIKFSSLKRKGIRDIKFDEKTATFFLPVMTPNVDTEVIFRNLVAHEEILVASGSISTVELGLYVEMMCGLINTAEDVKLLHESGIIKIEGNMSADKIVELFKEKIKSQRKPDKESPLQQAIDEVNKLYHSKKKVDKGFKAPKITMKQGWTILRIVVKLLLVIVMTMQAWCMTFGCRAHL